MLKKFNNKYLFKREFLKFFATISKNETKPQKSEHSEEEKKTQPPPQKM